MKVTFIPPCRSLIKGLQYVSIWKRSHSLHTGIICLLALFLMFLPFIGNAEAADGFEVTGTVSIRSGYYSKLPFAMATDGVLEFDIDVRSGPDIDVILIPYSELSDYRNGDSFTYYPDGTFSDCDEANAEVYLDSGTYCLILSNDGGTTASVHYSYTPTALQDGSDDDGDLGIFSLSSSVIVMIAFLIAAIGAVLAYAIYERKKARAPEQERAGSGNGDVKHCERCGSPIPKDTACCRKCGGRVR